LNRPQNIVVAFLLDRLGRPLLELSDHMPLDALSEFVGVLLIIDGKSIHASSDGMLWIGDVDDQFIGAGGVASEATADQVQPGLAVAKTGGRAVDRHQTA